MATVVVTGGNRGIGLALAKTYAAAGYTVIVGARDVHSDVPHAEVLSLDVTQPASIAAFAAQLQGRPVDLLINNAGVLGPERQSALNMDFDGLLNCLQVNTLGPLRVTQA